MGGALGSVGKAAGWVLGKAGEFAKMAYKGYKTVTGAITDFIGTTGKYVGGKLGIPGMEKMTLEQAFGKEGFAGRLSDSFSELGDAAREFLDTDVKGTFLKGPTEMKKIYGNNFKLDPRVFQEINKGIGGDKKEGENEEKVRDERVEKNELTKLVCLFDPKEADLLEDDKTKKSYIIGVGWDRKIHIWQDDKGQEEETLRTLP